MAEIAAIVGDVVDLLPRPPEVADVVEDADTLVGNARLKAVALVSATGFPAVADDTGLFVDALGGAPGVHSARYAGEGATYAGNRAKLPWGVGRHPGRVGPLGVVPDGGPGPLAGWTGAQRRGRLYGRDRRPRRWATGASATTRSSCPTTGTAGPSPR